ncbi:MAG: protein kinase [Candidatus Eisenbacteria bacterium]
MTLAPGTRLGPYEIVAPLGAGGMGEVHRARDTRLGRDVAIKALPAAFAQDPERLARFEREAKLLASLNHPNVAGIHGIEDVDGARYLVLEFVDGETLEAALRGGPLPLADVLDVARQVAAGVEAAHEAGVVHRDLKPGNVMLTGGGVVKVLDFGLAKGGGGQRSASSDPRLSASPTMTYHGTEAGMILGTAAYMSPEQARGKAVDRRTDIWSFGCVLFEMLTGRRAYDGETVSDMVARILERDPEWSALPAGTPPRLVALLRRCLTKDAKLRQRDIGDVKLELDAIAAGETGEGSAPTAAAPTRRGLPAWALAVGALVVLALGLALSRLLPKPERLAMALKLTAPVGLSFGVNATDVVLSPQGDRVVFVGSDSLSGARLWVRDLDRDGARALEQTANPSYPFWSPDGKRVGFFADDKLKIVNVSTGAVSVLADAPLPRGGAWGRGVILYQPRSLGPLWRISPEGGTPEVATAVDSAVGDAGHRFPQFLPDGKHFVTAVLGNSDNQVAVGTLGKPKLTRLYPTFTSTGVTFAAPDWLISAREGAVKAQRLDLRTLRLVGPALVVPGLRAVSPSANGSPIVSASDNGLLLQRAASDLPQRLAVVDGAGHAVGEIPAPEGTFMRGVLSHDGRHVAFEYTNPQTGHAQLWGGEIDRGALQPLTLEHDTYNPVYSPDDRWIGMTRSVDNGNQDVWVMEASGANPRLVLHAPTRFTTSLQFAPDGRGVLVRSQGTDTRQDLLFVDMSGDSAKIRPVAATNFNEPVGAISPDGRWFAYVSDESGAYECRVRPWGAASGGTVVSRGAWCDPAAQSRIGLPVWRRDGRQLLYCGPDAHTLMIVDVTPGDPPQFGAPRPLFRIANAVADIAVGKDFNRFVLSITREEEGRSVATLLANWPRMLETGK